jgi:hypothetical protein
MWPPEWIRSIRRDRLAVLLALVTVIGLGAAFVLSKGTQFLMPGPLASAHGGIEKCSACHTKSGSGKLSWMDGLVAGDPLADSKACLTCHKMPDTTAYNAHGITAEVLKQSTKRLTKIAAKTPVPQGARAQNIAFPTHDVVEGGLFCATCHQEHQGVNFSLNKISNEQCRSCHVVKFDSFDGNHPKFENYPFKQRTGIIYDHAGHFGKHYPELAKKDPAKRIPDTCSTCHNSREDKRVMAVAPFEQTCAGCHLDQIVGKERASGPKGVAFLTLPGLDLQTLKKKNASIGEWPDASDAALTPFMKVMISRNDEGRDLIKTVDSLNLQDLTNASDAQVKAVTKLAWEIKGIFYALIKGKASDVLGDFNIGGGAKLSAALVADLTASIPRDVVNSAQQQWLPNLATEMTNRSVTSDQKQSDWDAVVTEFRLDGSASGEEPSGSDAPQAASSPAPQAAASEAQPEAAAEKADIANAKADGGEETRSAERSSSAPTDSGSDEAEAPEKPSGPDAGQETASETVDNEKARKVGLDPPVCTVRLFGQCLVTKEPENKAGAAKPDAADGKAAPPNAEPDDGKETRSANELPPALRAGVKDAQPEATGGKTYTTNAGPDDGDEAPSAEGGGPIIRRLPLPSGTSRAIEGRTKEGEKAPKAETAKAKPDTGKETPSADEQPRATNADSKDAEKAPKPEATAGEADSAKATTDGSKEAVSTSEQPQGNATDQKDDLLFPTEEELRGLKTDNRAAEKSAEPEGAAGNTATAQPDGAASADATSKADANAPADNPASPDTAPAQPQPRAAPVISIDSDVDPENWAEYGGWYRQDYAIFYRPTGHKDKFIYSWLFLTGPQAPKGGKGPAAAVFDVLTSKDAQGSCTKCHSIDDIQGKGRVVNFSPPSVKSKQGRFTNFIHEPHFGILENRGGDQENRGCMSCHELEKGRPYLKSFEQGNPQKFVSNFGEVKKDLCQTCHNASMARQDCLTCHKYHVNDVITPIISTKIPAQ